MGFGEQRLVRSDITAAHRLFFRIFGVADPAHYLRWRYLCRALAARPAAPPPRRILDAGSGGGDYSFFLARRFPDAEILGIDLDPALVARGRQVAERLGLPRVKFEVADLSRFAGKDFDLIVCIDVLEHIRDQRRAFQVIASALSPEGYAFLHIPTIRPRPVPFSRWLRGFHAWAREEHVADELTSEQMLERVREAGLDIVESRRTFARGAGELANSLFALPFRNTWYNRIAQLAVAPVGRVLTALDTFPHLGPRYAVAVLARRARGPAESDAGGHRVT